MDEHLNCMGSQRVHDRLRAFLEATNRFVTRLDLPDLLREVTMSSRQVMQCDSAAIVVPGPPSGELLLYDSNLPRPTRLNDEPHFVRITRRVLETGKPSNLSHEEIMADPKLAQAGIQSCCPWPLASRGRVFGVLVLASSRDNAFADNEAPFLGLVSNQIALAIENAIAYGEISRLKDRLSQESVYLEDEIRSELHFDEIVGGSEALRKVIREIETVAPTDSTVLIHGETGTGKELIARAVHNLSARKPRAFVKLNCSAIPASLLESELFGHERGAFTGAAMQRVGRFELAHRGSIFLDEVGELPLELQPKLLRVLQEREFERLGGTRTIQTDARLIAATNRDLRSMVESQKFRSDLYYRLNVFPVRVPPLRERPEDIPLLVRHFVREFSRRNNRDIETIPSETMNALVRYRWPGNVRELQNVIERAVIVSKGPVLRVATADLTSDSAASFIPECPKGLQGVLDETERSQIVRALEECNWVVAGAEGAAVRLGMKRSTLQTRMQKLGIRMSRHLLTASGAAIN
jgi:formate hydrogenlyase transcriptional activator